MYPGAINRCTRMYSALGWLHYLAFGIFVMTRVIKFTTCATPYQVAETLGVIREVFVDFLVDLEGLLVRPHTPVAAGHHQLPLDLARLDLRRSLEVRHRLLVHLVLDEVRAEPRDDLPDKESARLVKGALSREVLTQGREVLGF